MYPMKVTIPKPQSDGDFFVVPEGVHLARLIHFIDLGTRIKSYNGEDKRVRQVHLGFELGEVLHDFGKGTPEPAYMKMIETYSSSEKANLTKIIKGWIGVDISKDTNFDVQTLFEKPTQLFVSHQKKENATYANITSVSPVHPSLPVPERHNTIRVLSLSPQEYDHAVYNNLPDGLKKKIAESPEFQSLVQGGLTK